MRAALSPGRARAHRRARRELWLGVAVLAVLAVAGWLSTVAISGLPWSSPDEVRISLPPGAPLLTAGDDVRIGGERVGQVQSVALAAGSADHALATLSIGSYRIGAGASARVRPRGLAGAVYVDLSPGDVRRPLRSGAVISAAGSVQLTDVIAGFDASAGRAMGQVVSGYGTGFAGRGASINSALAGAPPLLSDVAAVLRAVRPQPGALAGAIGDATTVGGALSPPGSAALAGAIEAARTVLQTTGTHAGAVAATLRELPSLETEAASTLPGADELLGRLSSASRELQPGVSALARALPGVRGLESSGPEVTGIAGVAASAAPVLRALVPVLRELVGPASGLTPLSGPAFELAEVLIPYRTELIEAPLGFTRWGNFTYDFGTGAGHRAVRFSMVLTCALARDPYPAPGAASKERKPCP